MIKVCRVQRNRMTPNLGALTGGTDCRPRRTQHMPHAHGRTMSFLWRRGAYCIIQGTFLYFSVHNVPHCANDLCNLNLKWLTLFFNHLREGPSSLRVVVKSSFSTRLKNGK